MPLAFQVRYGRLPDGATPLQQFINGEWVVVPVEAVESLLPKPNDTVSTLTPSSNRVLPEPLPTPAAAPDLDTLIASLLGGRPHECHVTHVDQCTATVDLRDLMRVAGPAWREKLAAIEATHATNQAARVSREAKAEAEAIKRPSTAAQP